MQSRNSSQVIVRACITVSGFFMSVQQVRVFVEFDSLPWAFSRDASHKCSFRCAELSECRKQNRITKCVQASSPPSNSTTQTEPYPLAILNSSVIVMLRPSIHDLRESGWQEAALTTSCRFARAYRSRTNLITKHSSLDLFYQ